MTERVRIRKEPSIRPTFILTADWHLREDNPICRTDDFFKTQWDKVNQIRQLQFQYECPVIHAGDLFHHWRPSPFLLSKTIEYLPENFWTVYGNHDLPQHNLNFAHKSGVFTLFKAGALNILPTCHWGDNPSDESSVSLPEDGGNILVWHVLTYLAKKPFPESTCPPAVNLLRRYNRFKLITTGDNHKSFTAEYQGRLLVNPGSLTRQSADQTQHRPVVYLWYAQNNTVRPIYLKCPTNAISREHLLASEERNERIDAFVSKLDKEWHCEINFVENLNRFFEANKVTNEVKTIIMNVL